MRRSWLLLLLAIVLTAGMTAPAYAHQVTYPQGVASGDVTQNRAILWTRVNTAADPVTVQVSTSFDFSTIAFTTNVAATSTTDFTVKVDASGLLANHKYYFRFTHDGFNSPVGTFKTPPRAITSTGVKFTFTADSDGTHSLDRPASWGNFEVLDPERLENGAFWVYLGDTIYSDSRLRSGGPAMTLGEYRGAYKENRTYAPLRNLFKSTSTYPLWDDHEVVNDFDASVDPVRYATGRKAFFEYMPIRTTGFPQDSSCAGDPMFRVYHWGSDVDLIALDERSCRSPESVAETACNNDPAPTAPTAIRQAYGFPASPPAGCLDAINAPGRTILGPVQKQALKDALLNSTAKFKFILNQDPIQQFYVAPYDRWEGYGAERKEILSFIKLNAITNVVFLTTDTHATLFNEVFRDRDTRPAPIAYETVTGPIATDTFETEINNFCGGQPLCLNATNDLLDYVGEDCRNLDTNSYELVNYSNSSFTTTLTSKDANGVPVKDRDVDTNPACTKTLGP
jgi:alkaline phosphatase D